MFAKLHRQGQASLPVHEELRTTFSMIWVALCDYLHTHALMHVVCACVCGCSDGISAHPEFSLNCREELDGHVACVKLFLEQHVVHGEPYVPGSEDDRDRCRSTRSLYMVRGSQLCGGKQC